MTDKFQRFRLYGDARVSAEFGLDKQYDEPLVTLRTDEDNSWQIEMSPWAARRLARRLTQLANVVEPPKPKTKA